MKRSILLITILSFALLSGRAIAQSSSDILLRRLKHMPQDTTRLDILRQVAKIEQNNHKCIQYSDSLLKEALLLGNSKYATLAAYYHVAYYYNQSQQDSVSKWIAVMEPHVNKSKMWDLFFDAKRFSIDLHTINAQYEYAISEANDMKQKALEKNNNRGLIAAYQCLSSAYIGSQRENEGIKALEEAYQLLSKESNAVVRLSVLTQLVSITRDMKRNEQLLKYLQEFESTLNKYIHENPALKEGFADVYLFKDIFYAHYYLNTHQMQKAYQYLVKSKKHLDINTYSMYQLLYLDACAIYHLQAQQYETASSYVDSTLNMLKDKFPKDYANQLLKKARIWVKAGQSEKAIPLYQRSIAIKDSTKRALCNAQMEQIKDSYKLDKRTLEQSKLNNQIRLACLIFISFILCLLFVIMYRAFLVRKALKRSESEIRKSAKMVRNANEMKNRFLSNMSYNIRTPLNNVVGFSQLIACEPDMDESIRAEYSDIIHKSSDYLMKLVNDVLDLSRLEAQMMKFQIQTYDAVALCNEVCYMAKMKNESTGIQVEFTVEFESQEITVDTNRLSQLLLSTLTYPQERQQERIIQLSLNKDGDMLYFCISNSPLADPAFISQETYIRNDINRLLIEHFGGQYQVNSKTPEGPEIVFTYPIAFKPE